MVGLVVLERNPEVMGGENCENLSFFFIFCGLVLWMKCNFPIDASLLNLLVVRPVEGRNTADALQQLFVSNRSMMLFG